MRNVYGKWLATATTSILLLVLVGHNVALAEDDTDSKPHDSHGTTSETEPTPNPRILVEGTTRIAPRDAAAVAADAGTPDLEEMLRAWENPPLERMGCSARHRQRQQRDDERARASSTRTFASLRLVFRNKPPNEVQANQEMDPTILLVE